MTSRLEQFIRDHREEFDKEEPSGKVLENIQLQMEPGKKQTPAVFRFTPLRWSAAAAIILAVAGTVWLLNRSGEKPHNPVVSVAQHPSTAVPSKPAGSQAATTDNGSTQDLAHNQTLLPADEPKKGVAISSDESNLNEEMYHYAKLVEIRHKELRKIEKDEPLLYKKFAGDVNRLDSVYHTLQNQLPKNPNREQLLEAMIQNLQLQMELLNHQLIIIKQINHSKKSAYENAYKSV